MFAETCLHWSYKMNKLFVGNFPHLFWVVKMLLENSLFRRGWMADRDLHCGHVGIFEDVFRAGRDLLSLYREYNLYSVHEGLKLWRKYEMEWKIEVIIKQWGVVFILINRIHWCGNMSSSVDSSGSIHHRTGIDDLFSEFSILIYFL